VGWIEKAKAEVKAEKNNVSIQEAVAALKSNGIHATSIQIDHSGQSLPRLTVELDSMDLGPLIDFYKAWQK